MIFNALRHIRLEYASSDDENPQPNVDMDNDSDTSCGSSKLLHDISLATPEKCDTPLQEVFIRDFCQKRKKIMRSVKLCPSSLPTSILAVEIDFDEAHDEWTANKRRKDNGEYVYICGAPLRKGKKCVLDCCDTIGLYSGCREHYSWEESAHKNSMS